MPAESLSRSAANCIDGVVMYASMFENLGMDPVVILVPGHAYVGVRNAKNSSSYTYLETAITGRSSFEKSVRAAEEGMAKFDDQDVIRIAISQAREAGIFPMPLSGHDPRHLTGEDNAASTSVSGR
jgi:hypothetical protein